MNELEFLHVMGAIISFIPMVYGGTTDHYIYIYIICFGYKRSPESQGKAKLRI